MIKFDVRKSIQYRYIKYKFKRECLKNEALQNLSEDEKEKILMKATKNTRKITWLIITIYIPVICWFIFGFIGNSKYVDNTFVKWFIGIYESTFPLVNGSWGSAWYEKKGTVLTIFIKLFPALIIQVAPRFMSMMIAANKILKKEIKNGMGDNCF